MDELKNLQKQLAEMRRLGQAKSNLFWGKYHDLIAKVYEELKKIHKRSPTFTEWRDASGTSADPINQVRAKGNYPLGKGENYASGHEKRAKTLHAKVETGLQKKGNEILGVKYRNATDKTKIRNILTKYFSYPTGSAPGGQTALFNKLRTIKDLKSRSHAHITAFMNAARKDLNISKAIQTEAKVLGRAGPLYNHILLSLSEHIRQGGKDFKYAPGGKATVYSQL